MNYLHQYRDSQIKEFFNVVNLFLYNLFASAEGQEKPKLPTNKEEYGKFKHHLTLAKELLSPLHREILPFATEYFFTHSEELAQFPKHCQGFLLSELQILQILECNYCLSFRYSEKTFQARRTAQKLLAEFEFKDNFFAKTKYLDDSTPEGGYITQLVILPNYGLDPGKAKLRNTDIFIWQIIRSLSEKKENNHLLKQVTAEDYYAIYSFYDKERWSLDYEIEKSLVAEKS